MFPNRQVTLEVQASLHRALQHRSVEFESVARAQCDSALKNVAWVFKVGFCSWLIGA
jgi:hypothetical protein